LVYRGEKAGDKKKEEEVRFWGLVRGRVKGEEKR
jgi:hypothetical protein